MFNIRPRDLLVYPLLILFALYALIVYGVILALAVVVVLVIGGTLAAAEGVRKLW